MLIQINIQQIKRRNTIKRSNTIYKIDHYHMEQFFLNTSSISVFFAMVYSVYYESMKFPRCSYQTCTMISFKIFFDKFIDLFFNKI